MTFGHKHLEFIKKRVKNTWEEILLKYSCRNLKKTYIYIYIPKNLEELSEKSFIEFYEESLEKILKINLEFYFEKPSQAFSIT